MERILVIDDDIELCDLLCEYIVPQGFDIDVAHDGATGLEKLTDTSYAILILDIMLPGGESGLDILRRIRTESSLPVIVLTARGEEVDRIVGLELGADDYLAKPFNPRELVARIRAILRRAENKWANGEGENTHIYRYDDIELDTQLFSVTKAGKIIKLTNVEFLLLELLMKNRGQTVSRETLAHEVLDRPLLPFDRSIDVHVCNLRKKLGMENNGSAAIKAIRGCGYVFISPPEIQ